MDDKKTNSAKKYPDFFKVFAPDQHSERMLIPNAFVKVARQQGWEPRIFILKNSSGKVWEVKTFAIYSQLFFDDGWKQFREDNCLGALDFILFTHVEDNVFNFKICEISTGCEKMKVEGSEEQEKEKDDVMELGEEEKEKKQDGDGDERDPGQDDSDDEVEEKKEQQQEDEDGDEHDPSEDDNSEEEEDEDEDDDDYDPGEKHGKEKYDVMELDDEEEEQQDEDGDEYDSGEDDSSDEEEQEEQDQQDEDDGDYDPGEDDSDDDDDEVEEEENTELEEGDEEEPKLTKKRKSHPKVCKVSSKSKFQLHPGEDDSDDDEEVEEENTELEEGDEEESKLTKKRKSHPKVCKVSSNRKIGSSSVTKAEDAGHENIDAAMYIRRDHPYFIVKPLKGRRNELHIPHLIIEDFSLCFTNKITFVCCQCQNIPRNQLRNYHRSLPQPTPVNKKHTEEGKLSVWRDGRVCIKGWLAFCRKNKIQENDTCICEIVLREDQPVEMFRVHVAKKN